MRQWIAGCGGVVVKEAANHGLINVDFTKLQAESCFNISFKTFHHAETEATTICSTEHYSVPASIAPVLDFVSGLTKLPQRRRRLFNSKGTPAFELTPAVVRGLYSVPAEAGIPKGKATQAVAAFSNESYLPSDLQMFQKMNQLIEHPVHTKIGPTTFAKGTGEGDLDVEWLMGIAPGIPTTVWVSNMQ